MKKNITIALLFILAAWSLVVILGSPGNSVTEEAFKALWPRPEVVETPRSWDEQLQDLMAKHCYRKGYNGGGAECPHEA